jgi:HK97 family phage portal protein
MNLKNFFRKKEIRSETSGNVSGGIRNAISGTLNKNPMALSAVYRCVDVISDSVASLPLNIYINDNKIGKKKLNETDGMVQWLNERPDARMSRFSFFKTLIVSRLLTGNGYAWIDDVNKTLVMIEPSRVSIIEKYDNYGNKHVNYLISGFPRLLQEDEMIHLINFSYDGLHGISTIRHAANTLEIASGGENQAADFFESGSKPSGVLTIEGARLTAEQKEKNYNEWERRMSERNGGMVILEGNQKYQPISISPADAQLLESREFSVIEVCRFFGVSPVKCFDFSKSSYSTVEATQLAFLTDTLAPILQSIELELNQKLFTGNDANKYKVKFDTTSLLRADMASLANYYRNLMDCGLMTPNEGRERLGLPAIEGGDEAYMQLNMTAIKNLGDGKKSSSDN